jgi:hypothetical protein
MSDKKNTLNNQVAEIRRMLIEAVAEGLQDKAQRSKASFLGVALGIVKAHGLENAKTPDEVQDAVEALREVYAKNYSHVHSRLPFRSSDPNEKPNTRPSASTSTPVPSILDDQDDADDQD